MIEVYVGSNICYECDISLKVFNDIMTDSFIKSDTFIDVKLNDGSTGYIKKGAIISFNDSAEAERR